MRDRHFVFSEESNRYLKLLTHSISCYLKTVVEWTCGRLVVHANYGTYGYSD